MTTEDDVSRSIAFRAAQMLKPIHDAYHAERARAKRTRTWRLLGIAWRYRRRDWLGQEDRARYRAIREELHSRGRGQQR